MSVTVTWQIVSEVSNKHSTYIFKCPAIQEELPLGSSETYDTTQPTTLCHIAELTLGSSETYDTTQPTALCHITEDLNPHLGSAYRMW